MNIAIIGSGNVGGALAKRFADVGHQIILGVRNISEFKGKELLSYSKNISANTIPEAVKAAEIIIISVPAQLTSEVAKSLGDVSGKIIIDTMNAVSLKPEGFTNTGDAIIANCNTSEIVKCFNTTGFENILNPIYEGKGIDMFTAGSSEKARQVAQQLAKEIGFENVYHFGGNDKFTLIEQFAFSWINLAILQKQGRDMAFRIVRR
ncbi:MAG: NAD(P)-binding domain-containing protein [Bacteroidetes bacterium]|nr:NAD(P)-binding domain-containing protein [Bacteroidota bacterium]